MAVTRTTEIIREIGLVAKMADGVELVADAWYPATGGPFPVLLQRLPYGRSVASAPVLPSPTHLARRGYAVVVQDVRGRGDSGGVWEPFASEAIDGAATIEWAADLPFSDGRVVTYGFSYQGLNQLAAAALRPRGLAAVTPIMCAPDARGMLYCSGTLMWEASVRWAAQLATAEHDRIRRGADLDARPLTKAIGADPPPWYFDWIERPATDPYWAALAPDLAAIEVPIFTVLGWADTFSLPNARLLREVAAEAVCGPWAHMPWGTTLGSLRLEDAKPDVAIGAFFSFLERVLTGAPADAEHLVEYYSVGGGWRSASSFPPPGAPWVLHASSATEANSRFGDGTLSEVAQVRDLADTFVSEPLVPYPATSAPFPDVRADEERRDVLCYTSAVLVEARTIACSPVVQARIAVDGTSVDLVAALVVVTSAKAIRMSHGVMRLEDLEPDEPRDVTIELGPIAWDLAPGDALRLDLSATATPLYAVNPQASLDVLNDAARDEHIVRTVHLHAAAVALSCPTVA